MNNHATSHSQVVKEQGATQMSTPTRVISFTSGKGGVGKTHSLVNTGIALAQRGRNVLLFDADLGLANIDVLLGIQVEYTLHDVFEGRKTLDEIIVEGPEGISIIPAASGVDSICNLTFQERSILLQSVEGIAGSYDYLLIDTPAGIGSDVIYFNCASNEIVCVINGEPTSLTDAYALIKVLSRKYGEKSISILVNNVASEKHAQQAYSRLSRAVNQFLHIDLRYLGWVPSDATVRDAVTDQRAVIQEYPSSKVSLAISSFADRIEEDYHRLKVKGGVQFFFQQLLDVNNYGKEYDA